MNRICITCGTELQDKGFCPRCDPPQREKTLIDFTKEVIADKSDQHGPEKGSAARENRENTRPTLRASANSDKPAGGLPNFSKSSGNMMGKGRNSGIDHIP
jgi:hypothetical protein